MFLPNKSIKYKKFNYRPKKMSVKNKTQYGGDVVMFLPNKIIKNKKLNYPQNKCWPCPKQPMVLGWPCTWF